MCKIQIIMPIFTVKISHEHRNIKTEIRNQVGKGGI